jgi:WD40 repeat protein
MKPKVQGSWNAALQTLEGHTGSVTSAAFSPDSKQVVSGSGDHTVRVSGFGDRTVRLWDAGTGALLQTLEGHTDSVYSVAFSPDGKQAVSGSDDHTVRLWDAGTEALLQTLEGHTSLVSSVAFSPDGKLLPTLLVSDKWVVEDGANILWLPSEYRTTCIAVWDKNPEMSIDVGDRNENAYLRNLKVWTLKSSSTRIRYIVSLRRSKESNTAAAIVFAYGIR